MIDGQTQVHFMQRLARRDVTPVMIVERVRLEIDNFSFDIKHSVFAFIATNIVASFVQELAPIGGW